MNIHPPQKKAPDFQTRMDIDFPRRQPSNHPYPLREDSLPENTLSGDSTE